jgi:hypothetical protein
VREQLVKDDKQHLGCYQASRCRPPTEYNTTLSIQALCRSCIATQQQPSPPAPKKDDTTKVSQTVKLIKTMICRAKSHDRADGPA